MKNPNNPIRTGHGTDKMETEWVSYYSRQNPIFSSPCIIARKRKEFILSSKVADSRNMFPVLKCFRNQPAEILHIIDVTSHFNAAQLPSSLSGDWITGTTGQNLFAFHVRLDCGDAAGHAEMANKSKCRLAFSLHEYFAREWPIYKHMYWIYKQLA